MADFKAIGRWVLLTVAVMVGIIVPFLLFGHDVETWTAAFINDPGRPRGLVALVLGGLLATDIVLPVPSSLASTACGLALGFSLGMAVSSVGMTLSCAFAWLLARPAGRRWGRRLMGAAGMDRFAELTRHYGDVALIIVRPVPVLAEVSVLAAAAAGMPARRFFMLTTLSNVGISAVYAAIGAFAATLHSFLFALAGSLLLPWLGMLVTRRWRPKTCAF